MPSLQDASAWLQDRLPGLLAKHQVPGAAVAVCVNGEVADLGFGVLSKATGVEATADSVFQVGSITKPFTSTLLMQLVDEGLLDIDSPARHYLSAFKLADDTAAATITVRQLMSHTGGFEGDVFTDTGPGDDCLEKFVDTLGSVAQLFPPGEMFSYNNAGFCVLGRIIEVLRGKQFDTCIRERLFKPLELTHAATSANEAILHRAAVGHIRLKPEAEPQPAPVWSLARSNAPAGSMLAMRPRDLLAFAQMHMAGGAAADGTAVLSSASVKAMQEPQVQLPSLGLAEAAWGLGWQLYDWPGGRVMGHDGGTIGQAAFLRMVPDQKVAIALLTNGGAAGMVYREVYSHLLRELTGIEMPPLPEPPTEYPWIDPSRYLGVYASEVHQLTVSQDSDGRVWLDEVPKGVLAEMGGQPQRHELVQFDGDTLITRQPDHGVHATLAFVGDDGSGRALYLHRGRATRRVT